MNLKIFNQDVPFDRVASFSKQLKNKFGSTVLVATKADEPVIKVSVERLRGPHAGEHILQIPLEGKRYETIIGGKEPPGIGGKEPPGHYIVIGGREPDERGSGSTVGGSEKTADPLIVELDPTKGRWRIEPDVEADVINVHYNETKS